MVREWMQMTVVVNTEGEHVVIVTTTDDTTATGAADPNGGPAVIGERKKAELAVITDLNLYVPTTF